MKVEVEVNDAVIRDAVNRQVQKTVRDAIANVTDLELERAIYARLRTKSMEITLENAVNTYVEGKIISARWETVRYIDKALSEKLTDEERYALAAGFHIAALANCKYDPDDVADVVMENAGREMADSIRRTPARYKKLIEILKESLNVEEVNTDEC